MTRQDRPVAFFDSGLGGISILRETVRLLPKQTQVPASTRRLEIE